MLGGTRCAVAAFDFAGVPVDVRGTTESRARFRFWRIVEFFGVGRARFTRASSSRNVDYVTEELGDRNETPSQSGLSVAAARRVGSERRMAILEELARLSLILVKAPVSSL